MSLSLPLIFPQKKTAVVQPLQHLRPPQGSTPYLKQLDLDLMPLEQQRHLQELQSLEVALRLGTEEKIPEIPCRNSQK